MSVFEGFNRRYQAELQEEIDHLGDAILAGNYADFVEYQKAVRLRLGYLNSLERHKELLTLMEQANDK